MINYSIYPDEVIFADWDNFEPKFKEIETSGGITLIVEQINEEEVKIARIISSNPLDYLRTDLIPGMIKKSNLQL